MKSVLTLSLAAVVCAQSVLVGAVTKVTNLTVVPQRLPWNDARDACHHRGGHLVQILDQTKLSVIQHVTSTFYNNNTLVKNVSMDLALGSFGGGDFYWTEDCLRLTWASWMPDEFSAPRPNKRCVMFMIIRGLFRRASCAYARSYICERNIDERCPYTLHANTTLLPDGVSLNSTTYAYPLEQCLELCDNLMSETGAECWAVTFQPQSDQCTIFFTTDPYLVINPSHQAPDFGGDLYTKHCYNVVVGGPYVLNGDENKSLDPIFNCSQQTAFINTSLLTTITWDTGSDIPMENVTTDEHYSRPATTVSEPYVSLQTRAEIPAVIQTAEVHSTITQTTGTGGHPSVVQTTEGHLSVVQTTEGHPSVVWTTEGHPSVVQTTEGHLSVVQTTEGHPSVVRTTEGHPSVVQTTEGYLSVVQTTEGHPSVIQTTEGYLSVVQTTEGHSSVIQTTEGHPGVIQTTGGHPSVVQTTEGHPSVIQTTEGHPSVVQTTDGHPSVIQTTEGHLSVVQTREGHPSVIQTTEGHLSVVQTTEGHPSVIGGRTEEHLTTSDMMASTNSDPGMCYCVCRSIPTEMEKRLFLEEVLVNLTIDRRELASFRRKYISVMDERPLAVGIGYCGVICLAFVLGLISLCDAASFVARYKKHYR